MVANPDITPFLGVTSGWAVTRPEQSMSDSPIWHSLKSDEKVAPENAVPG